MQSGFDEEKLLSKIRLDLLLCEKGYYNSREKAKAAIMSAEVYINNICIEKAGTLVADDCSIEIKDNKNPYVGRGGLKLKRALDIFNIDVKDKVFLDIGASTGGFTDCLLKNGAKKIYAIDVGYGQLDYSLRIDERVTVLERTNFRYLSCDEINEKADGFVMDVSFISILKLMDNLKNFLKYDAFGILLIKPQFESSKEQIEKKGIIKNALTHKNVLKNVATSLIDKGYFIRNITYSDIKGAKGNIEFLYYVTLNQEDNMCDLNSKIDAIVLEAHKVL